VLTVVLQRCRFNEVLIAVFCFLAPLLLEAQNTPAAPELPGKTGVTESSGVPGNPSVTQTVDAPQAQPGKDELANQPANDQDSVFVFKKEVEEVILHATVVDGQRRLVPNLDRNTFSVFENGAPQKITSFRQEDVPVALGVVVDNSGSMRDKRDKINQAVLNLIRAGNPGDEIFVVNFSQFPYLDQDFTSDINLLQQALQKISQHGSTALYDAIVASSVHLRNNTRMDKKALLVITDGHDNASRETLQEAARRLQQENGPTLYAVGLLGEEELRRPGREALKSLADSTGGVAFFPRTLDEVNDITQTVAHDIRSQYTIGYKSTNPKQNTQYRTVRVEARARPHANLTVRTRSGYYPGKPVP